MDETVVKRFAPFTPLANPLRPLDPMPVFAWKAREATPDCEFKLEISKDAGCRSWPVPDLLKYDPIRESRDKQLTDIENLVKKYWGQEGSREEMTTLYTMMKLVENATTVRIDLNGEEMVLTPHRLAMYGDCRVKQIFVNIESELEMELEER